MPPESQEQQALHQWCQAKRLVSYAVPNGGSRNMLEAVKMKREGVTAGVSDYQVMLPHKILFIEMKKRRKKLKNGKMSKAKIRATPGQISFLKHVNTLPYAAGAVCEGAKEAIAFIQKELQSKSK